MTDDRITQLCVCDEEFCYCDATTEMALEDAAQGREWECPECRDGRHVAEPGGARA